MEDAIIPYVNGDIRRRLMSSFTRPLTVTKIGKRTWRVERAFRYYIGEEYSDEYIDVPKGFVTDFASVPRVFWTIFPPDGSYTMSAVLHDYLYNQKGHIREKVYSRKQCDQIFREAMKVLGVNILTRNTIYRAVRMFGWLYFKRIINKDASI